MVLIFLLSFARQWQWIVNRAWKASNQKAMLMFYSYFIIAANSLPALI